MFENFRIKMDNTITSGSVMEEIVGYVSKNGVQKSIEPVFRTNDFVLYQDDSLEVLSKLPDNYVDIIFVDPPYMLSNDGFSCRN